MILLISLVSFYIGILLYRYLKFRYHNLDSKSYDHQTTMQYKTFKSIYLLNPEKWRYTQVLETGYNTIRTHTHFILYNPTEDWGHRWVDDDFEFMHHAQIVRVHFTFLDWIRFSIDRPFKHTQADAGMTIILSSAEKDIARIKQQAQNEIDEANHMMASIIKNGQ